MGKLLIFKYNKTQNSSYILHKVFYNRNALYSLLNGAFFGRFLVL